MPRQVAFVCDHYTVTSHAQLLAAITASISRARQVVQPVGVNVGPVACARAAAMY